MTNSHHRIIRRPADATDEGWARLRRLLDDAVRNQRQLASESPDVLDFVSNLEESGDGALYVTHEPATPLPIAALFDPASPPADEELLLRVSTALFSALATAHTRKGERPIIHGGICPGTILLTPDGQVKVSDFGFAPAFSQAISAGAYGNLAVGPPSETGASTSESEGHATAIWEVLDPQSFGRDDRICGFIDPEKYGTQSLGSFEVGSDIIAAGFVLHLMAEHQHPYLYADREAHRIVEMSEFMGMGRYNGARRQDLRESEDPAIILWCDLIAKTLSRLPKNRPSALEIIQALGGEASSEQIAAVLQRKAAAPKSEPYRPASAPTPPPTRDRESGHREAHDVSDQKPVAGKKKAVVAAAVTFVAAAVLVGAWQFWPEKNTIKAIDRNENTTHAIIDPNSRQATTDRSENDASKGDEGKPPPETDKPEQLAQNQPSTETGEIPAEDTKHPESTQGTEQPRPEDDKLLLPVPPDLANADGQEDDTESDVNSALIAKGEALTQRVAGLDRRLHRPTHQTLSEVISERTIDTLRDDVRDYWGSVANTAGTEAQSRQARDQVTQLNEWKQRISSYEQILNMEDKSLEEQVRLLEAAREIWPTTHVEDLLSGLPIVAELIDEATRKLGRGEWRLARFIIDQAEQKAEEQNLASQLSGIVMAARQQLARDRYDQIQDAFAGAKELLARIGNPPEPIAHLARTDEAASARNELDRFDLDFPINSPPGDVGTAATSESLLPWTELSDEETAILESLIAWTTPELVVGDTAFALVFVQSAPAIGNLDPIWIGQTEVTVGQYQEVMRSLPSVTGKKAAYDKMRSLNDNPVAFVPADQIRPFCAKLMEVLDNRVIVRPPTESEWKYALSAGGHSGMEAAPQLGRFVSPGSNQLELDPRLANFESDENYFTFAPGHLDGFGHYAPVRSYPPNRWLLYDMLGNVSEWVTTSSGSRLSSIGGSYVDRHAADARVSSPRDMTAPREEIGIRIVVTAAP